MEACKSAFQRAGVPLRVTKLDNSSESPPEPLASEVRGGFAGHSSNLWDFSVFENNIFDRKWWSQKLQRRPQDPDGLQLWFGKGQRVAGLSLVLLLPPHMQQDCCSGLQNLLSSKPLPPPRVTKGPRVGKKPHNFVLTSGFGISEFESLL
ncbi:Protein Prrc2C [Manis pentadactyla]|nr:Protein Prrc2C [Manis pentadactyla]